MPGDGGRVWLQYWFWLYYNPKNLFGFGKHEGDWEMIQIGLDPGGDRELRPTRSTTAARRASREMEWVERDGGRHPSSTSRRCRTRRTSRPAPIPYPVGIDHPYGDGPEAGCRWSRSATGYEWPGRWGNAST